jgi:hypothetical protein
MYGRKIGGRGKATEFELVEMLKVLALTQSYRSLLKHGRDDINGIFDGRWLRL